MVERGSLIASSVPLAGEVFREIVRLQNVIIEEIVSSALPDPVEYRQSHDEWVVVLEGAATLVVDGEIVTLGGGEWVLIGAQTRHRVLETERGTRWLAVHVHPAGAVAEA